MQALEDRQRVLVIRNYSVRDTPDNLSEAWIILISPRTDVAGSTAPLGRSYDVKNIPKEHKVNAIDGNVFLVGAPGGIVRKIPNALSK
jgi:hypothetical protein